MAQRIEKDTMGEMFVPKNALYGAQTARAVLNFPISGETIGRELIRGLAQIKVAAASVNQDLGLLDPGISRAIISAASAVADGHHDQDFPIDIFQTGSGTSSNMNANEVIARLATIALGGGPKVHPNDHVNLGQSSNDVFPSALHLASLSQIEMGLLPALEALHKSLETKEAEFSGVVTTGRTHLQDATPITLAQIFSGYASQVKHGAHHLRETSSELRELALGGTAVGTGLNTHPEFGARMADRLSEVYHTRIVEASNHFEAQSARDAAVRVSGALKSLAVSLIKIANDLRWLASGPRLGLGEITIPPLQPGSSIMPAKVNPVIAEAMIQVAVQVIGNDAAITAAGFYGHFQLNAMIPLIARNLLEQIRLFSRVIPLLTTKLVAGIVPLRQDLDRRIQQSLALVTGLVPRIGYDRAAALAKTAEAEDKTIAQVVAETGILSAEEAAELLDPLRLTTNRPPHVQTKDKKE